MKKLSLCIITALSLVSLGILTACGVSAAPKEAGSAQLPNPFIPCADVYKRQRKGIPEIIQIVMAGQPLYRHRHNFPVCHK